MMNTPYVLDDGPLNVPPTLLMCKVVGTCPHLVYLDLTCFGHVGPLSHGKGFQQNANFAAGVAGIADEDLLGYQLVSQIDYATGFLGAYSLEQRPPLSDDEFPCVVPPCVSIRHLLMWTGAYGVILGLIERQAAALEDKATAGVMVHTSLVQAATWMASLGARPPTGLEWLMRVTRLLWRSDRRSQTVSDLTYLPPSTAVRMSITPPNRHCFERWWPDDAPTDDLVVKK